MLNVDCRCTGMDSSYDLQASIGFSHTSSKLLWLLNAQSLKYASDQYCIEGGSVLKTIAVQFEVLILELLPALWLPHNQIN